MMTRISSRARRASLLTIVCIGMLSQLSASVYAQGLDEDKIATEHFNRGRKLYTDGKYQKSADELEKAFKLRPAPAILLNIGRCYEKLKQPKKALGFYQRYLLKARLVDPNRPMAEKMVKKLEKKLGVTSTTNRDLYTPEVKAIKKSDPKDAQSLGLQLIHTPVDMSKVKKDIRVNAELPPDVDVDAVWVYFRKGGQKRFRSIQMEEQGDGYFAIIPGKYATSTSMQYYLVAKKKGYGKKGIIAKAGSKKTPYIIVVEGGRAPHLGPEKELRSPYRTWMWVAAGTSLTFIASGVTTFILAKDRQSALETRADQAQINGGLPNRRFDQGSARDFESEGKTFATISGITLGIGIASAAATGALWYLDRKYLKAKQKEKEEDSAENKQESPFRITASPWASPSGAGVFGRIEF